MGRHSRAAGQQLEKIPATMLNRRTLLCLLGGTVFTGLSVAPRSKYLHIGPEALKAAEKPAIPGRTFYVSSAASDGSPTGRNDKPFISISQALNEISDLGANDTVIVLPGIYNEQVTINKGGNESGDFSLRALTKHTAFIRSPSDTYSAVNIVKDYVVVDGFDVKAGGTGHGIEATFLDANPRSRGPHHIRIINNVCHNNPGSGIGVAYGDYYLIEKNICYDNCHTNGYQGSGISIYSARAVFDQSPGFHNFVRNNLCSWNIAIDLPGHPEPPHSDANGIIIDDFHNSQTKGGVAYNFHTLVENNIVNNNGGKGIQIYLSDNVVIRNNTSYHNNRDPLNPGTWRGELSNALASNNTWINNLAVANPAINQYNTAISDNDKDPYLNHNVLWYNNLTFNGEQRDPSIFSSSRNRSLVDYSPYNNIFGLDPLFISAGDTLTTPNFRLRPDSPAVGAGTTAFGIGSVDYDGRTRNEEGPVDIGAFQMVSRY